MTFLLSEDKALRLKLQGMTVHDQKADGGDTPRSVGVWFGQPDQEVRGQNYPYVTIDMVDLQRDTTREMRGYGALPSYVDQSGVPEGQALEGNLPIPVNIDYQITAYSRQPRHDREILAQLLGINLPIRFGYLEIEDGTIRRLDVLSVSKRDVTESAKRLFVNAITVRVSSELPVDTYNQVYNVLSVHVHDPDTWVPYDQNRAQDTFEGVGNFTIS